MEENLGFLKWLLSRASLCVSLSVLFSFTLSVGLFPAPPPTLFTHTQTHTLGIESLFALEDLRAEQLPQRACLAELGLGCRGPQGGPGAKEMGHSALGCCWLSRPQAEGDSPAASQSPVRRELEYVLESVGLSLFHMSLIILEL